MWAFWNAKHCVMHAVVGIHFSAFDKHIFPPSINNIQKFMFTGISSNIKHAKTFKSVTCDMCLFWIKTHCDSSLRFSTIRSSECFIHQQNKHWTDKNDCFCSAMDGFQKEEWSHSVSWILSLQRPFSSFFRMIGEWSCYSVPTRCRVQTFITKRGNTLHDRPGDDYVSENWYDNYCCRLNHDSSLIIAICHETLLETSDSISQNSSSAH